MREHSKSRQRPAPERNRQPGRRKRGKPRKAIPGDAVEIIYQAHPVGGSVDESAACDDRLAFRVGAGEVSPCLEGAVLGMRLGGKKTVTARAVNAFGLRYADRIHRMHRSRLPQTLRLKVGEPVVIRYRNGVSRPAKIVDVHGATVTLDANHPLAGRDVVLELQLVAIERPPVRSTDLPRTEPR